ncbi:hydrogen gas-evolving membrane-bound hydrogenase subunit E [Aggregatilineales bacterium SYSU G02658]
MPDFYDDDARLTRPRIVALALSAALVALLSLIILTAPGDLERLNLVARERLTESGVANPVTAVLLNFRGYDTLLEVAVLLLAVIGIWSMARYARVWIKVPDTPVLAAFVRLVLPLMVLVSGYLLWLGADAPGGAFQGGAVLGGMGILWIAAAVWLPDFQFQRFARVMLVLGLIAFVGASTLLLALEGSFMEYPAGEAKNWILVIESAAMISIGMTLMMLFVGGIPRLNEGTV